jgi:hypothetical protein
VRCWRSGVLPFAVTAFAKRGSCRIGTTGSMVVCGVTGGMRTSPVGW